MPRHNAQRIDGDSDELILTGAVQLNDADSVVWADKVVMEHETGNGTAEGAVRVTYLQPKDADARGAGRTAQEPVHVLAARAEFKQDAGKAMFYGAGTPGAGGAARLWEGTSQVEAPVLEFERTKRRLVARGDGQNTKMVVHAVFVSGASVSGGGTAKTGSGLMGDGSSKQLPVRVASHELVYDDVARRADFSGGVLVEDSEGTMRAQQAAVYLKPADSAKAGSDAAKTSAKGQMAQEAFMGGSVERMVASGGIEIVQPGRSADGGAVGIYGGGREFLMTGRPGLPPKMTDVAQGVITGASLRFHAGDNSVVISNGPDAVVRATSPNRYAGETVTYEDVVDRRDWEVVWRAPGSSGREPED